MKYFVVTFGCQMNEADSKKIASALESKNYKPALDINKANLVVVNMCSVRQSAVDRVYGIINKLKNSKTKTILTGCILKKDRNKFRKLFDEVINIEDLTQKVEQKHDEKSSAVIPIMTGCNNFCSYCVVPYTRGREKSRPAKEIICEVESLIKRGYKEIWLLGQNVNSYSDIPFPELLRKINNIPGKFLIRFTSSHPKDFSDDLIKAMAECKKVANYLNLPIQSGDDEVLKKMNRPYTVKQYKDLVKKIRKIIPDINLSTDVIVGFPGETEKQFENTAKLFKEIKFSLAYINKYSPRYGTVAEKFEDDISPKEKKHREKVLENIIKETKYEK
ncbi:MiaB/RimO family radical SAM methylthiotransferase [Patescibacteria group bacterium]|nr:MiaB/RimO family radical SAM methylthiotransferase [Patescibacteria group bacterium]